MKALFALAFLVAAQALWVQMEPELEVHNVQRDWTVLGDADPSTTHEIMFSLNHDADKMKELDRIFWEVSDPKHANYGKYLTDAQVTELLTAPQVHIDSVMKYVASFGVQGILGVHKDTIVVTAPVATVEKMLNCKLVRVERKLGKASSIIVRSNTYYYLPHDVVPAVAVITGLLDYPGWRAPKIHANEPSVGTGGPDTGAPTWTQFCNTSSCSNKITPGVIAQQYKLTQSTPINAKSSVAVAEFQTQYYDTTDLNTFTSTCNVSTLNVIDKNGGNVPSLCTAGACVESLLDLEYLHAVGGNFPLSDYFYLSYSILNWITQVNGDPARPLVHSVSYGNDEVQQTSTSYMFQCNTQFQTAATLGLSIMFASGDQGVWGRTGCCTVFHPDFPASSPYITAVGGTDFMNNSPTVTASSAAPEQCCVDGGGGFSNTFNMPSFQTSQVNGYLTSGVALPAAHFYNASGRAYPDVSANFGLIVPYCMYEADRWVGVSGTSASSPVFTSLIANLNNVQLNKGKASLGWLNPWLYGLPSTCFFDVTVGQNNANQGMGFNAAPKWDPCSGLGTGQYNVMVNNLP
jgi:tripeptidyl-peptidase-1